MSSPPDLAVLFARLREGDGEALGGIMGALYTELRALAARRMRVEDHRHTLQPTALVNEAYVRLANQPGAGAESRSHFLAVAAMVMRSVLVDHARARQRAKRGGNARALSLGAADGVAAAEEPLDVVALDDALNRLAAQDARKARVVELRYFVGLSIEETAKALDSSPATVKREWTTARAWLRRELTTA